MDSKQSGVVRKGKAARTMVLGLLVALVAVAITGIASAQENTDLKFRGGIGVIPVTGVSATGAVNLNVVRGVNPAGPWRIADLDATVTSDGHIRVKGRGLLLAAGNGIGTNAGASVFASLFCGAAATATEHDSGSCGARRGRGLPDQCSLDPGSDWDLRYAGPANPEWRGGGSVVRGRHPRGQVKTAQRIQRL